jgi:hypothetical protein
LLREGLAAREGSAPYPPRPVWTVGAFSVWTGQR